jgi:hypothetical protein
MDSSAFKDKDRKDGSGKRDVYFNGPGDRRSHGHVVEKVDKDGNRTYPFVRDVEGNVYADDRTRERTSPTSPRPAMPVARTRIGLPRIVTEARPER